MNGNDRLYRSRSKKVIGGIAGGLGDYLNIDPVILRVIFVIFTIFNGLGLLLYIIMWIIVPEEPYAESFTVETENGSGPNSEPAQENAYSNTSHSSPEERSHKGRVIAGVVLIALGMIFLAENWFPYFDFEDLFPVILIIGGGLLVFSSINRLRGQK